VLLAGTAVAVATLAGPVSTAPAAAATVPNPLVVVYMENQSLNTVIGTGQSAVMPYLNSLWHSASTEQFTDYYAVAHPSFPNYAAVASGETQMESDAVTPGEFSGQAVWDQLQAAGVSWGVYEEAVPTACYAGAYNNDTTVSDGPYKIGHNPAVPFAGVFGNSSECQKVQPFTAMNPAAPPAVSFVTPNLCDDMHGLPATNSYAATYAPCTQSTNAIRTRGDSWLARYVPQWTAAGADVLITFDEGGGTAGCCGAPGGGQIYGVLTGPGVTGGANATPMSEYSILAGIEDAYGLPLLGNAATASPVILPGSTTTAKPVVTITSPASNATVSGTLAVSGTAADTAGISQVQVSVDGGTPVTATGTTTWSTSTDTTQLSNGTHTITATATDANGNAGTASVTVTVNNTTTATSCPATAPGATELSGNVSLETSQSGWTGVTSTNSVITRVQPPGGSYDGSWALQVAPKTAGAAGVNNASPIWVPGPPGTATTAGRVYTGSAFVEANTHGEQITLLVRETTPAGTGISSHATSITASGAGWQQITSAYTAKNTGDLIRYSLAASNLAAATQHFLADCLSLQTP
jgi:hypothetical protein